MGSYSVNEPAAPRAHRIGFRSQGLGRQTPHWLQGRGAPVLAHRKRMSFSSLLLTVTKPWRPELEEKQYLAARPRCSRARIFRLISLVLLIKVNFWCRRDSVNRLIEELAADITLYLKSKAPYTSLIVAIWDDGVRTEEHAALKRGLADMDRVSAVIVVNRPTWMQQIITIIRS